MSEIEESAADVKARAILLKMKQREDLIRRAKGTSRNRYLWIQLILGGALLVEAIYESKGTSSNLVTLVIAFTLISGATMSVTNDRISALLDLILNLEKEDESKS